MDFSTYYYPVKIWRDKIHKNERTGEYAGSSVLSFIMGNRRGGKSVNVGLFCILDFLMYGYRTCLLTRYKDELDKGLLKSFWNRSFLYIKELPEIVEHFPQMSALYDIDKVREICNKEHEISFDGTHALIDGDLFCYSVSLNRYNKAKKQEYIEGVYNIVMDEFIAEDGSELKDEYTALMSIYDSIARDRNDSLLTTSIIMMSNAITTTNIYFHQLGIQLGENTKYILDKKKGYTVDFVTVKSAKDEITQSAFGRLLSNSQKGREYLGYSQDNAFYDNLDFVTSMTGGEYLYNLRMDGTLYAIKRIAGSPNILYITSKADPGFSVCFTMDSENRREGELVLSSQTSMYLLSLRMCYDYGRLYFDSLQTKKAFSKVYK